MLSFWKKADKRYSLSLRYQKYVYTIYYKFLIIRPQNTDFRTYVQSIWSHFSAFPLRSTASMAPRRTVSRKACHLQFRVRHWASTLSHAAIDWTNCSARSSDSSTSAGERARRSRAFDERFLDLFIDFPSSLQLKHFLFYCCILKFKSIKIIYITIIFTFYNI